jgi:hypothetical protein
MNYSFDIGPHATSLGFAFLFFKYLLPVVIGAVLIVGIYLVGRKILTGTEMTDINRNHLILAIAVGLILLAVMLK